MTQRYILNYPHCDPVTVELSILWAQETMSIKLYEYMPQARQFVGIHYILDKQNDKYEKVTATAPPLVLHQDEWAGEEYSQYEQYVDDIVNDREKLTRFGDSCYAGFSDNFLRRLFGIFMQYEAEDKQKVLLDEIYKMLLTAHIIGHTAYIEEEQVSLLSPNARRYYIPGEQFPQIGLANRQIKTIYLRILDKIVKSVLDRLQGILRSSDHKTKWMGAFMCMLGMAMACEEVQSTTDTIGAQKEVHIFGCNEAAAKSAVDSIDRSYQIMCALFHMKYKSFAPMSRLGDDDIRKHVGDKAMPIIKAIKELCSERYESFLLERRCAPASINNVADYYGRQVARFLLGFWTPDSN